MGRGGWRRRRRRRRNYRPAKVNSTDLPRSRPCGEQNVAFSVLSALGRVGRSGKNLPLKNRLNLVELVTRGL